jgi:hypothetical protein
VTDGRTIGIGDGRDGGGGDARTVPATSGFVTGSESSEAGLAAAGRGMGSAGGLAGFVGDEPTASFGPGGGVPGFPEGAFFIFTTFVGEAVSGRALRGISCPSLPL